MRREFFKDVYILCPFFTKGGNGYIQCEGLIDCSAIRLLFTDEYDGHPVCDERDEYAHRYCESNYTNCEIYKTLMKKYKED